VPTEDLIIANQIRRENRIYIGQVLRIPGRGKTGKVSKKTIKKTPIKTTTPTTTPVSKPEAKPTQPRPTSTPPPTSTTNTINKTNPTTKPVTNTSGDTQEALEKPGSNKNHNEAFDATLYNLDALVIQGTKYAFVTVAVEETMGHYAEWLNTSVRRLRRLNRGRRHLRVHQKIKIPLNQANSLEQFNAQRMEYHMALEEDFYSQYQVVDTKTRVVAYGDTLWSICNRDEEIPIWLLKKYNRDIDLEALKVKMQLTIPVLAPKANGNNGNNNK
jgi:membrane-bound lytic murein transglycosylase D